MVLSSIKLSDQNSWIKYVVIAETSNVVIKEDKHAVAKGMFSLRCMSNWDTFLMYTFETKASNRVSSTIPVR